MEEILPPLSLSFLALMLSMCVPVALHIFNFLNDCTFVMKDTTESNNKNKIEITTHRTTSKLPHGFALDDGLMYLIFTCVLALLYTQTVIFLCARRQLNLSSGIFFFRSSWFLWVFVYRLLLWLCIVHRCLILFGGHHVVSLLCIFLNLMLCTPPLSLTFSVSLSLSYFHSRYIAREHLYSLYIASVYEWT